MKRSILGVFLISFFSLGTLHAQISEKGTPLSVSQEAALSSQQYIPSIQVQLPDIRKTKKSKQTKIEVLKPVLIGALSNVDIDFSNSGSTVVLPDGSKVWRLQINMPGAPALGLYYDQFYVPQGVRYFLYNSNKKQLLGAYTTNSNPDGGQWATEKVQGSSIILEMDIDAGVDISTIKFHINKVCDFYAGISYLDAYADENIAAKTTAGPYYPFNGSSPCEINAICSVGDSFPEQRKATVNIEYVLGSSVAAGSSTLINNTRGDCTPYLLTASHVEGTNSTADSTFAQWLFYFNYEAPTCTYTGTRPVPQTMTGATFISRAAYFGVDELVGDFLLVKLKTNVPASYGAYFAGWDLDTTVTSGIFTGFHHPAGDIKKVSVTDSIFNSAVISGSTTPTHWGLYWNQGGCEEGSSGSGLFNAHGRLIGMLSAGGPLPAEPCTDTNFVGDEMFDAVVYSKLSRDWLYSYETPSTPASRLKDWLDPDNTGVTHLDARAADCAATAAVPQIETADNISIYPNPTNGVTYATVALRTPSDMKISVYNIIGDKLYEQDLTNVLNGKFKIDLNDYANGMYIISVSSDKTSTIKKIILNR